jgi:signal transduction histidine kinase
MLVGVLSWLGWALAATASPPLDTAQTRLLLRRPNLPDTQRVRLLDELCWRWQRRDLPTARRYGEQGLALARRTGDRLGLAHCLNDLGTVALYQGERATATDYYQQVLSTVRGLPASVEVLRLRAFALSGLGNTAAQQDALVRAEGLMKQARATLAQLSRTATSATDRALLDLNLSNVYVLGMQADRARPLLWRALGTFHRAGQTDNEALALRNLGLSYYQTQHLDSALHYWRRSLALHQALADLRGQAGDWVNVSVPLLDRQRWNEATRAASQALRLARLAHAPDEEANALGNLAEGQAGAGDTSHAYTTLQRYLTLHDSLRGAATARQVADLEVRFRVAEQQQRIQGLTRQREQARQQAAAQRTRLRQLAAGVAVLAGLLTVLAGFYRQLRRSRARLAASEAELRVANQTKDQLMTIVGHDLRGPMASFQQVGPLLLDLADDPDPAELRQLGAALGSRARGVAELLDNLLDWARSQAGQVATLPQPTPLRPLAEHLRQLFEPLAEAKGVQLLAEWPGELPTIETDANLLRTVLRNLLSNAVKFTPQGGEVRLRIRLVESAIRFEVLDTGPGLAPEQRQRWRAEAALLSTRGTAGEKGTGLGLAVSRRFVALLGGELMLENGPEKGTRWWFEIPA